MNPFGIPNIEYLFSDSSSSFIVFGGEGGTRINILLYKSKIILRIFFYHKLGVI